MAEKRLRLTLTVPEAVAMRRKLRGVHANAWTPAEVELAKAATDKLELALRAAGWRETPPRP